MKENVLLIFGGKSVEHDISIITALQAMKNLPDTFEFLPLYIDRSGIWWVADNLGDIEIFQNFNRRAKNAHQVALLPGATLAKKKNGKFVPFVHAKAALNCCHGGCGEDGSVQGLLKMCGVPQSSCGVMASAVCMDKAIMKEICLAKSIPTPNFFVVKKEAYNLEKTIKKCKFPLVVKPANLGSSIGISVCKNKQEFSEGMSLAFNFDRKVVVEELVQNLREFNCACFSFDGHLFVSNVNEVTGKGEIFSFEDKYLSSTTSARSVESVLAKKIGTLTEKVYDALDCTGIVRVDFLYDEKTKILYVNEVNTIPGSLAFYLFPDVAFKELISAALQECISRAKAEEGLISTFDSDALKIFENARSKLQKK